IASKSRFNKQLGRVQMRQERHRSLREGINPTAKPTGTGCFDCLTTGGWWLHLRGAPNVGESAAAITHQTNMPQSTMRAPAILLSRASSTGRIGSTVTAQEISLPGLRYQVPTPTPWTNPCLDQQDGCP
ncbi:MAG: hypothetical protein WBE34_15135, partial [Candidatus Nitrosopolaris sp.]